MSGERKRKNSELGQSMVEFTILLLVFLTLGAGMLYVNRLLNFDYWAEQEARYIAFERTWVGKTWNSDPLTDLDTPATFHRPKEVNKLDVERTDIELGGFDDLFAWLGSNWSEKFDRKTWTEPAPNFMLAWKESLNAVETALASQFTDVRVSRETKLLPPALPERPKFMATEKILELVKKHQFGEKFCVTMRDLFESNVKYQAFATPFTAEDCPEIYSSYFAFQLAKGFKPQEIFRAISERVENGQKTADALEQTMQGFVAREFYSFFDTKVKSAFNQTVGQINDGFESQEQLWNNDSDLTRLENKGRYLGSSVALDVLEDVADDIRDSSSSSRNWQNERNAERDLNEMLHYDATENGVIPGGYLLLWDGFELSIDHFPFITEVFRPLAPGLFNGAMRLALDQEDSLESPLIDDSNVQVTVEYTAEKGLFSAARARWSTSNKVLSSSYFLVTEPWHIQRRSGGLGPYRGLGSDDDQMDDESDEAMLRRRTFGYFVLPTPLTALFDPLTAVVPELEPIVDLLSPVDDVLSWVKDFVFDNPLLDVLDWMNGIPGFDSVDFTFPRLPAVRPAAYPHTSELTGDRSTGSKSSTYTRDFNDFIQEQKDHNPPPKPEFYD
ncbi:hypothetical protein JNK13_04105 [bacterium]|nr:hypothetical protein [bacterium]